MISNDEKNIFLQDLEEEELQKEVNKKKESTTATQPTKLQI